MYYNHNLRTNLQEWKNRLYKAPFENFGNQLRYLLSNIEGNRLLTGLYSEAVMRYPYSEDKLNEVADNAGYGSLDSTFENETQHASFCYQALKYFIRECNSYNIHQTTYFIGKNFEDSKENVIELLISPMLNYFHDRLDKSSSIIYLLEKYKRRTEWFTYVGLLEKYSSASKGYEQIFEDDLRLFLFDQGIDYPFSTPKSTSGRGDIIGAIDTEDPVIIEIKIFDRTKGYNKNRVKEGFSQIIKYANDYNKDVGYLVVFNVDTAELNFALKEKNNIFPPMVGLNNKAFFLIVVNLYGGVSASKIGTTEVITIDEAELTE